MEPAPLETDEAEEPATIGLALGSFDTFHIGHQTALSEALRQAGDLVIAVADDDLTTARRGRPPTVPGPERVEVVSAFFPTCRVELVADDSATDLDRRFGAEVVFVAGPAAVAASGPPTLVVVPFEMTASASILATGDADVLWMPR